MKSFLVALLLPVAALAVVGGAAAAVLLARDADDAGRQSALDEAPTPSTSPRLAPESNVCQGLLHVPEPGAPRSFPAEYTQRRDAAGFAIVGNAAVDAEALDIAAETVERVFLNNDLEEALVAEGAYVVVADAEQGVLDLPEFRCLDSERNQDFFSHVCGVADRADYPVVTVNEQDLLGSRRGPCGGLNILFHELGHLVQGWTLPPADYYDVKQYFQDALGAGKYKDDYASRNSNEYFAEATQAYFLHGDLNGQRDREWLADYDPQIFDLLERTYGD